MDRRGTDRKGSEPFRSILLQPPSSTFDSDKPRMQLRTEGYNLSASREGNRMPVLGRTHSTPPDSPTRTRAQMGNEELRIHRAGAITPPPTPTTAHSKSSSVSSAYSPSSTFSLSSLRRNDSVGSTTSRRARISIDESERPGSTELRKFLFWISDYEVSDKRKPLGSGLWSDVYLAVPSTGRMSPVAEPTTMEFGPQMTPPLTPVKAKTSSPTTTRILGLPRAYAIKSPASKSANKVLSEEARVLSYLSRLAEADRYIVPFFGQDTRTDALVLGAMDITLEDWINTSLNMLPEAERSQRLAQVFPSFASRLIEGLQWMNSNGCIHADIKPSNILLSRSTSLIPSAVYSDFSSSTLSALSSSSDSTSKPDMPLGGGTWDFLDPRLCKVFDPVPMSLGTELWALSMTLLYLVIGASPFDCEGSNQFRRREIIKQGCPVGYAGYGDDALRNMKRVKALSEALGFDVKKWFEKVLKKDPAKRVSIVQWKEELDAAVGIGSLRL